MTPGPVWTDAVIDYQDDLVAVIRHDARDLPLEDESVDLIVTSPPYFALRSYRDDGEHYDGQIGSEDTPDLFLDALDECMVEWGRVLKPSGSIWINLGDKYAGSGGHNNAGLAKPHTGSITFAGQSKNAAGRPPLRDGPTRYNQETGGAPPKSLMGLPWRFAIRQIDAGWILRAEVVWDKPNGLPESVTDRVRRSHETWFHMVKEPRYFSGVDEIREPHSSLDEDGNHIWTGQPPVPPPHHETGERYSSSTENPIKGEAGIRAMGYNPLGRLPGSVWRIPSEPLLIPDDTRKLLDLPDHFAAFPQEFPRRIILGWSPVGGIVLDPMGGTGTVAGVARMLGRYGISNDLSASYNRLAAWRIHDSGHFQKTEQRTWADRQGVML